MGVTQSIQLNHSNPNVRDLITNKLITSKAASRLTFIQESQINLCFSYPEVQELILGKHIPSPWYPLTEKQCLKLTNLHGSIIHGKLKFEEALTLSSFECKILKVAEDYIYAGMISIHDALNLSLDQCSSLENTDIKRLILQQKIISIQDILTMSRIQHNRMELGCICEMLALGKITLERVDTLSIDDLTKLKALHSLICTHHIDVEQGLKLAYSQCQALQSPFIFDLIKNNIMTIEEASNLTPHQLRILNSPQVVSLLTTCNHIKLSEVITLRQSNVKALRDRVIYDKVAANELDIRLSHIDFLANHIPELLTVENALLLNENEIRSFRSTKKEELPAELKGHFNRFFTPSNHDPLLAFSTKKENRVLVLPPR